LVESRALPTRTDLLPFPCRGIEGAAKGHPEGLAPRPPGCRAWHSLRNALAMIARYETFGAEKLARCTIGNAGRSVRERRRHAMNNKYPGDMFRAGFSPRAAYLGGV
jgi:hypothetical protein